MAINWHPTITWSPRQPFTAERANNYLRDNLDYLAQRPRAYYVTPSTGSNIAITSTSLVALDDAQYTLTINNEFTGLEVEALFWFQHNNGGGMFVVDVLVDDVTYVSTGTATPAAAGLFMNPARAVTTPESCYFKIRVPFAVTAGTHTFKIRVRTNLGTLTVMQNGYASFFQVTEVD